MPPLPHTAAAADAAAAFADAAAIVAAISLLDAMLRYADAGLIRLLFSPPCAISLSLLLPPRCRFDRCCPPPLRDYYLRSRATSRFCHTFTISPY